MKKGQPKISSESKKKQALSKDKNTSQSSISKSQSTKKEQKSIKGTSSSKQLSVSKSNIQSGYSSISKDKKPKKDKIEEIPLSVSTGKKMGNKSPEESQNLSRRRNALKSSEDVASVKKTGKNFKKEDEIKVESGSKNDKISAVNSSKRGRAKQNEEEEKMDVKKFYIFLRTFFIFYNKNFKFFIFIIFLGVVVSRFIAIFSEYKKQKKRKIYFFYLTCTFYNSKKGLN
jgi:hypothetical protein